MKHHTSHGFAVAAALVAILASIGCGPPHVSLPSSYYDTPDQKVAVVVLHPTGASLFKTGGQGLLDMAISEAMTGELQARLSDLDGASAMVYLAEEMFEVSLDARGVDASAASSAVQDASLPAFESGNDVRYGRLDIRGLAARAGVDQVLVLDLSQWGLSRKYYGFIALGPPKGYSRLDAVLLDARDNGVLWRYAPAEEQSIAGTWNQAPAYPNAVQAVARSLVAACNTLLDDLDLDRQTVSADAVTEMFSGGNGLVANTP